MQLAMDSVMGGDAEDIDGLPALKCRLCKLLRDNGYSALHKSIRTQAGHYGMFLGQGAIEM
jgi:hypothetical protein